MAKKIKKSMICIALIASVMVLSVGCASLTSPNAFYSDSVTVGVVRGEVTSRVWLGIFGTENYPAVDRVASENNIRKIATVERYMTPGIFNLWMDYTTIVTGE